MSLAPCALCVQAAVGRIASERKRGQRNREEEEDDGDDDQTGPPPGSNKNGNGEVTGAVSAAQEGSVLQGSTSDRRTSSSSWPAGAGFGAGKGGQVRMMSSAATLSDTIAACQGEGQATAQHIHRQTHASSQRTQLAQQPTVQLDHQPTTSSAPSHPQQTLTHSTAPSHPQSTQEGLPEAVQACLAAAGVQGAAILSAGAGELCVACHQLSFACTAALYNRLQPQSESSHPSSSSTNPPQPCFSSHTLSLTRTQA